MPKQEIAKRIDFAFLPLIRSPSKGLNSFSPKLRIFAPLTLPERDLLSVSKINPEKAAGPDGAISNWLLKESAEILAFPVTTVLTSVSLS